MAVNYNKVTVAQIRASGAKNLSEYKKQQQQKPIPGKPIITGSTGPKPIDPNKPKSSSKITYKVGNQTFTNPLDTQQAQQQQIQETKPSITQAQKIQEQLTQPITLTPTNQKPMTIQQAITQGNTITQLAREMRGKTLSPPTKHDPALILEQKAILEKTGVTPLQTKYEYGVKQYEKTQPILNQEITNYNQTIEDWKQKYTTKPLTNKEQEQALKELNQIKQTETNLEKKISNQSLLYKTNLFNYKELEKKLDQANKQYSKQIETKNITQAITPSQPTKKQEPPKIGLIPLSKQLGFEEKVGDTTKLKQDIIDYQKTDLKTNPKPAYIIQAQKDAKDIQQKREILGRMLTTTAEASLYLFPITTIIGRTVKRFL